MTTQDGLIFLDIEIRIMSKRKKSTELSFGVLELKFSLLDIKLDRVRKQVTSEYDLLIERHLKKVRTRKRIETVSGRVNAHRDSLNSKIETAMVDNLNRVKSARPFEPVVFKSFFDQLCYFKKQINDAQLSSSLKWILLAEGVLGRFNQKRYNFVEFSNYNIFLNLYDSALNPSILIKKRFKTKPVDFYLLPNRTILFRYVDKSGQNCVNVVDHKGNLLYSRVYDADTQRKYFSLILDNDQTRIHVLYNNSDQVRLEIFDNRLNLQRAYSFTKFRHAVERSKPSESFVWNFLVNKDELLVSYRVEINGFFDLYYLVYDLRDTCMTIKSVIGDRNLKLKTNQLIDKHIPVNKMSCLIYFTEEFYYFVNHDVGFNRYLEIVYRFSDGRNLILRKLKLDDSYSFFFDSKSKKFIAYKTKSGGNNNNISDYQNGEYERESFKLCEYEFEGNCVYENTKSESLYDLIKYDHFKVYFKNMLNIGLTGLFRGYFSSKVF
jgi:hypothetical protein